MLRPRQFSLLQILLTITGIAIYLGFVRYLLLSGHGEWLLSWLIAAFTVFIGGIMAAVGCWSAFHSVRLTFFWPKALARIERYDVRRSDGRTGQPFYHPVLRFETASGQPVVTISSFGSWRRPWNRGDTVTVHYHPAEPHWAEIATIFNIWGMPLTFLGLAIWTLIAGYWMTMP